MKHSIITIMLLTIALTAFAQNNRDYIRKGNRQYADTTFREAAVCYLKAIKLEPNDSRAIYNLGNSLFMQNKANEAFSQYSKAATMETNKFLKSHIYHNMGVIRQTERKFDEAIEAYKNALRLNPHDDQTRYNLVLCQRQRKEQKDDNKNKQQKQDKQKQDKQNKKDQDKQNKQEDKKEQEQNKQQDKKQQMSKDNAEQLLNAARQQERNTQEKINKNKGQNRKRQLEKNW